MGATSITDNEIDRLNKVILDLFEYDFSAYAKSSYTRRLERILQMQKLDNVSALIAKLKADPELFYEYLRQITVNTTEMFRDPPFWKSLRKHVMPELDRHDVIRIWLAGCSSGEEAYSMAILLQECGMYEKSRIFATDINDVVLETARSGTYHMKHIEAHAKNYIEAGGEKSLSDYYSVADNHGEMHPELMKNVMFKRHNLVNGEEFSKFDLILCRNVIIYFNPDLQDKVFKMFRKSMFADGFLGIGSRESLIWASEAELFEEVDLSNNIFRLA